MQTLLFIFQDMGSKTKKERIAARQAAEAEASLPSSAGRTALLALITSLVVGVAIATQAPCTQLIRTFMNEQGVSLELPIVLPKVEGHIASTKTHLDFDSFYPFYLSQVET